MQLDIDIKQVAAKFNEVFKQSNNKSVHSVHSCKKLSVNKESSITSECSHCSHCSQQKNNTFKNNGGATYYIFYVVEPTPEQRVINEAYYLASIYELPELKQLLAGIEIIDRGASSMEEYKEGLKPIASQVEQIKVNRGLFIDWQPRT
jgi:hypothetical protein